MIKSFVKLTVIAIIAIMCPKTIYAQAAVIAIDGQFDDWDSISSYDLTGESEFFEKASVAYDEMYVYLYVKEAKSAAWETNYPTVNVSSDGYTKSIVLVRTDYSQKKGTFNIEVNNNWWVAINNATGKVTRAKNYNEWEIKLPIYSIYLDNSKDETEDNLIPCELDSLQVSWSTGGEVVLEAAYIGEPIPSVTPTPSVAPTPGLTPFPTPIPEEPVGSDITIDGYYDDWENLPKTEIYYNKNFPNSGSVVMDEYYIYLFIEMNAEKNNKVPLSGINLTINNQKSCQLFVGYPKSDGTTDWSWNSDNISKGIHTGLAPFTYYPNNTLGDAAVEISTGAVGDRLELRVDIDRLEQNLGLEKGTINSGADIKVILSNVGKQEMEVVGVSTGAFLGILSSILSIVLINAFRVNRKRIKE